MENELFYLQQALELRQEANEAIKAIRFILGMKTFDPMNIKDYSKLMSLATDLEIVTTALKSACKTTYEKITERLKQ